MNHYMGIDIGTSGCKSVIFNEYGRQVSIAYREYDIISKNPGWAELDTDEVIEKCFEVIRESSSQTIPGSVVGIGISSQGEAFTLIDEEGRALCNALVSSDIRANDYIGKWIGNFGEEKLYRITGHTPHPMFSLFKLLWIKENMPEIWARAYKILCFEDLLQYRLGINEPGIGWSLAGRTMLFDVIHHKWNDEILRNVGVRKDQLSIPLQSGTIVGNVNADLARDLNLSGDTFIVTGGHDQPSSALGAGAIEPGIAVYSLGTVDCITPAFEKPLFTSELRKNNLCTYDHTVPGLYATVAFSLTGGNLLKWFRDEFGIREVERAREIKADPYDLLLNQMPGQPTGLLVLPYFTPSGTPYFDVNVKGAIFGLDLNTSRGEILKALLEGIAFEMRLNLEILEKSGYEVKELRAIGGGARSLVNLQLRSDVIGKPITVPDVTETGCLGVAMLVRSAHTNQDLQQIAYKWIKPVQLIKPSIQAGYNKKFDLYKNLYPGVKRLFH